MAIMSVAERAAQIWPVLALAATHRQVLTYSILGRLIGVPARGLGHMLEPIQAYCVEKQLPPLTIIVVLEETGLPGSGFTAESSAALFAKRQMEVFQFEWLGHAAPTPEALAAAAEGHSSIGEE